MKTKQKFPEWSISQEDVKRYQESGHVWKEDRHGIVDVFAFEECYCNGPVCIVCGYSVCWHCEPEPEKSECYKK